MVDVTSSIYVPGFLGRLANERAMYFYGVRMGFCYFAEFVVGQQTKVGLGDIASCGIFLGTSNQRTWYLYWI